MDETKIVEAVGTAVSSKRPGLAKAIEEAMAAATLDAMKAGFALDSDELREAKLAAREAVKAQWRAADAAAE